MQAPLRVRSDESDGVAIDITPLMAHSSDTNNVPRATRRAMSFFNDVQALLHVAGDGSRHILCPYPEKAPKREIIVRRFTTEAIGPPYIPTAVERV
jgi:hypothetical protein